MKVAPCLPALIAHHHEDNCHTAPSHPLPRARRRQWLQTYQMESRPKAGHYDNHLRLSRSRNCLIDPIQSLLRLNTSPLDQSSIPCPGEDILESLGKPPTTYHSATDWNWPLPLARRDRYPPGTREE